VLVALSRRCPKRPLGAIGVSLGGNVLLKYLGEEGAESCLTAAAAISVPYDLSAGADHLMRPQGDLYATFLLRSLRRKIEQKRPILPATVNVAAATGARSFRSFDQEATAPLHGFADADEYYRQCSSARFLDRIRVPTLLVHSRDDPFLPPECIPRAAVAANPHLVGMWTERGGHVGFVAGRVPLRPEFWAERRAVTFVSTHLLPGSG
jgi:predicted alpha/beta-fold hydrolase